MLKTIPLLLETMQCPISKPQRSLPGPWSRKSRKTDDNFQKRKKNANFVKKIDKICDIQKLKPIPWQLKKKLSNLLSNTYWDFLAPGTQTTWIMTINVQKKLQDLWKNANIHDGRKLKTIPLSETMQ